MLIISHSTNETSVKNKGSKWKINQIKSKFQKLSLARNYSYIKLLILNRKSCIVQSSELNLQANNEHAINNGSNCDGAEIE